MVRQIDTHSLRDVQEQYTAEKNNNKGRSQMWKMQEDKPVPIISLVLAQGL